MSHVTAKFATKITRDGGHTPDYTNRKPFRTKAQKRLARETAWKGSDGAYHSDAPVSFHGAAKSGGR
jgi:hypothetical protein